jgi:hypothetical protein
MKIEENFMSRREIDKIHALIRHITNVQQNCLILGEKLMERGEFMFAKMLIARGFRHDNTKFFGSEWDNLVTDNPDKDKLKLAIDQHNTTNEHHPESWDKGIHGMPRIALAELVCDFKARSSEFGTDLREYIDTQATKRYSFNKNDKIYEEIMYFVDLVCDRIE